MASPRVLYLLAVISALAVGVKANPRTRTFPLNAKTSVVAIEQGSLYFDIHSAPGVIKIVAEVIGGIPKPNTYLWTVQRPDGSIVTMRPGEDQASPIIINPSGNPSTTLTISETADIPGTFKLDVSSETDGRQDWSTSGTIIIRGKANPRTRTFPSNAKTAVVAIERGTVNVDIYFEAGGVRIVAEVVGGIPKPNTYLWTVQQPDGSFVTMRPGEDQASPITINDRGNPSTTLTITEPADFPRTFTLDVSSETNGSQNWGTSATWTVGTGGRASR